MSKQEQMMSSMHDETENQEGTCSHVILIILICGVLNQLILNLVGHSVLRTGLFLFTVLFFFILVGL
jgi:hypothetical protein